MKFEFNRMLQIVGFSSVIVVTVLNYLTHTPLIFIISLFGIILNIYSSKKIKEQFNVPLFFIRRGSLNYWSGGLGALIAGSLSTYAASKNFEHISIIEFSVELSWITIYLILAYILFMGTILQDIEDGYIKA